MIKTIPYIVILILLIIVFFQFKSCSTENSPVIKTDTVTLYIPVKDTVIVEKEKIKLVQSKKDTVWLEKNKPDTTYNGLLEQYKELGNKHFSINTFQTKYQIRDYGSVTVTDTIKENSLIGSSIITDLNIPEKTITIEKYTPVRQLYFGPFIGQNTLGAGGLYKDKKDRIYFTAIEYKINENPQIKAGLFFKIR